MKTIDKNLKQKLVRLVKAIVPDAKIYLFGSYATGNATELSDIDLAIESNTKLSRFDIYEIKSIIEASNIIEDIDIVDLDQVDLNFKKSILEKAVLWTD